VVGRSAISTICFAPTHRRRRLDGRVWSPRFNLDASGILILTLCPSTWRPPAIPRRCWPHTQRSALTVDHGAPLRLLVPVKLGLKNVKAITRITYSAEEPKDYWAERGYSRYDEI